MCGIIGYNGHKNSIKVLINGLKALEYRGYDSAGIAYYNGKRMEIIKTSGRIFNLEKKLKPNIQSNIGIGHTRWATHGKPNDINSHPHRMGKFTIVHNGIIENYEELKKGLIKKGYKFKTETDSEVIAALLDFIYSTEKDVLKTISLLEEKLIGAYALGILCDDEPNILYATRKDSPLIVGIGNKENFIASDVPAILKYTNQYIIIEDNEIVKIDDKVTVYKNLNETEKKVLTFEGNLEVAEKNGFDHFMLKEIHEEPSVIKNTTEPFLADGLESLIQNMPNFSQYKRIEIVGCGSAYHAGLVGKAIIEKYTNTPVAVYIASEFRYQKLFTDKETLVIFISQSGETADTLASLRKIKSQNIDSLAIVNVVGSSLAREAKNTIYIKAGPEISVATTKAYLAQVAVLSLIALNLGYKQKIISENKANDIIKSFIKLPTYIEDIIDKNYKQIAKTLYKKNICFYIGRGIDYALSMEGSLKLKEISYIVSMCYPAGELKHGTISLIDKGTNVISVITDKTIADKTLSNIKEVKSRGAVVTLVTTEEIANDFADVNHKVIIPKTNDFINPMIAAIPLQLISYETAKLRGCDIDKPKNLAKSVTVE